MVLRVITFTESRERYQKDFSKLSPGTFFRVQLVSKQRIFYVLEIISDKEVSVLELSTSDNKKHLQQEQQLVSSVYHYDPIDCLNIIETGESSDDEDRRRKYYNLNKYISDNLITIKEQSGGKDVITMKFQGTCPSSPDFNPKISYWKDYDELFDNNIYTYDYVVELSDI